MRTTVRFPFSDSKFERDSADLVLETGTNAGTSPAPTRKSSGRAAAAKGRRVAPPSDEDEDDE
jgi:hypothetical protein